jgi:hypothetical protein
VGAAATLGQPGRCPHQEGVPPSRTFRDRADGREEGLDGLTGGGVPTCVAGIVATTHLGSMGSTSHQFRQHGAPTAKRRRLKKTHLDVALKRTIRWAGISLGVTPLWVCVAERNPDPTSEGGWGKSFPQRGAGAAPLLSFFRGVGLLAAAGWDWPAAVVGSRNSIL